VRQIRLTLLGAIAALAVLPAASQARVHVAVGIGNQQSGMFDSAPFQALGVKKVRYFIHWDAAKDNYQLRLADEFVDKAKRDGAKVLMHISTDNLRSKRGTLPSTSSYKKYVGKLVTRYKAMGVTDWGAWNEVNHNTQPTYKSPATAAKYFPILYGLCKGCRIVALDVLDQAGVTTYIKSFYRALNSAYRSRARTVGIHNYSDVNRKRSTGTASIIKAVKAYNSSAKFWFTETGGVVGFGKSFPCSQSRAASRTSYMFSLAKKYDSSVERLYIYSWDGTDCKSRFDAGMTNADGSTRPAYDVVKSKLPGFDR